MSRSHVREPYYIKRLLTETAVRADDRRAIYVGADAYEKAGGIILRDLFDEDRGGWYQDPALLEQLVFEKLKIDAEALKAGRLEVGRRGNRLSIRPQLRHASHLWRASGAKRGRACPA